MSSSPRREALALDFLANFAGNGWSALAQLLVIPFYLRFLGVEAYGVLGFYATLQATLRVFDLGLSTTVNRELARHSASSGAADKLRDLVRTLEAAHWAVGLLLGASLATLAPWITAHWVRPGALPEETIRRAVRLMGLVLVCQWPLTFYHGALIGLRRMVAVNAVGVAATTLGAGGGVLVLALASRSVTGLLAWLAFVGILHTAAIAALLWRCLPPIGRAPRFSPVLVRGVWRFAAGTGGIGALAILVAQADKLVLSRVLPLAHFGYYTIATAVAGSVTLVVAPVFGTLFPRFAALRVARDDGALRRLYQAGSQAMAALLLPFALVVAFFAPELVALWTRDAETARQVAPVARVLVLGAALHGLVHLPYALQLADGWTRPALVANAGFAMVLLPLLAVIAPRHGGLGAAWCWLGFNVAYLVGSAWVTHRRLLADGFGRWLARDVAVPLLAAAAVTTAGRLLPLASLSPAGVLLAVLAVGATALGAATLVAPRLRAALAAAALRPRLLRTVAAPPG